MRLALATSFAAALLTAPLLAGAVVEHSVVPLTTITPSPAPITHVLAPALKLPSPTPTSAAVNGPPANPATPTLWLDPVVGKQVILSNISESITPQGSHGCMQFTITATLNPADAVTVLSFYTQNEIMREARVYAPPSVVYYLTNAVIKSYSASDGPSGSSVHLTLNPQKMTVMAGGASSSDC
jgi:hypothetical protein